MRKIALIAFVAAAVAAQAQVTPIGPFITPPIWQEDFDTTAAGPYAAFPVFGTPAVAQQIGTGGALEVMPYPGLVTNPHLMVGRGVDVRIVSLIPMRRFGGWFRSGFFGVFSPTATLVFRDTANNIIGFPQTIPMTANFTWFGWQTVPKWRSVEIYGAVPGFAGMVGLDSISMRPN